MVKNCDRGLENAARGANKEQWRIALTDLVAVTLCIYISLTSLPSRWRS